MKSNIALKLDVKLTEGEPKASALVSPRMHQHSDDTVLQQGIAMVMFEAARYAACMTCSGGQHWQVYTSLPNSFTMCMSVIVAK